MNVEQCANSFTDASHSAGMIAVAFHSPFPSVPVPLYHPSRPLMSSRFIPHLVSICLALEILLSVVRSSHASTFAFGGSQNGMNGLEAKSLASGGFSMVLGTSIPGTKLNEPQNAGLGIDSQSLVGADDNAPALFNVIGGSGPLTGVGEGVQLTFDRPGILTAIDFDGVKDESLEYFILETPSGQRINFFDSAANTTIPGAVDNAVTAGAVTGNVIYLLELNNVIDDEAQDLHIPFAAGEAFTLTFQDLGSKFGAIQPSNGARLQSITVAEIPEPATYSVAAVGCLAVLFGSARWRW